MAEKNNSTQVSTNLSRVEKKRNILNAHSNYWTSVKIINKLVHCLAHCSNKDQISRS